jgi:Fe-S cluster biogenesis protein NfuA
MKRTALATIHLLVYSLALAALVAWPVTGQQQTVKAEAPAPITLGEQEQQELKVLVQAEREAQQNANEALNRAVNTAVSATTSIEIHAALKEAWGRMELLRSKREAWLARAQLAHNCKGCGVSDDGRQMIRQQ